MISGHKKRETAAMILTLCVAQFVLRRDALMRFDQAFDSIPRSTVFLRLVCTGRGVLRGWGAPKVDGLTDVELMGCH